VFHEADQLDALRPRHLLDLRLHHGVHRVEIHEPGVVAVIRLFTKPVLVDRADHRRSDERRVEVFQAHGHRVAERVYEERESGQEDDGCQNEAEVSERQGHDHQTADHHYKQLPQADDGRNLREPAGEEERRAEGRGADVEHKPLAGHPQVLALARQHAALGELDVGDVEAGDLPRLQLPLDVGEELLAGGAEPRHERVPVLDHVRLFRPEDSEHISPCGPRLFLAARQDEQGRAKDERQIRAEGENMEKIILQSNIPIHADDVW
jgi:hypothetical protein